jgi:hypothetical protein
MIGISDFLYTFSAILVGGSRRCCIVSAYSICKTSVANHQNPIIDRKCLKPLERQRGEVGGRSCGFWPSIAIQIATTEFNLRR